MFILWILFDYIMNMQPEIQNGVNATMMAEMGMVNHLELDSIYCFFFSACLFSGC